MYTMDIVSPTLTSVIESLSEEQREALKRKLLRPLTDQEQRFVEVYCEALNLGDAKRAAGGRNRLSNPRVAYAIEKRMAELAQQSGLTAEYVRGVIQDSIELDPTEYFLPCSDGTWQIDPMAFRDLPERVRRLVQVKPIATRNGVAYAVEFLDKQAALAMAARFTMKQQLDLTVRVPWEQLAQKAQEPELSLEDELAAYESALLQRSAGVEAAAVAEDAPVQQAEGDSALRVA